MYVHIGYQCSGTGVTVTSLGQQAAADGSFAYAAIHIEAVCTQLVQTLQAQKAEVQQLSAAAEALGREAAAGREAARKLADAEAAVQRLQEDVEALQLQAANAQEVLHSLVHDL